MARTDGCLEALEVVACFAACWLLSWVPWVTLGVYQFIGVGVVVGIWFVLGLNWKEIGWLGVAGGLGVMVCKAAAEDYMESKSLAMLVFGGSVWLLMFATELKWVGFLLANKIRQPA